ncbi:hypothetical protein B0813_002462 [Candidatus Fervidibacteria bacterium JGI MDM2 SSWTFF-3-K9]
MLPSVRARPSLSRNPIGLKGNQVALLSIHDLRIAKESGVQVGRAFCV